MSSLEEAEAEAGGSPARSFDVVVIGGGQTGLATAWHLKRQGLRYVVLEAADQLGDSWRARWSSLRLFTPAEYDALPGMPFPAPDGTYPGKDAVADYLRGYVEAADLDVELGSRVTGLSRTDGSFECGRPTRRCSQTRSWWPPDRSRPRSSRRPPGDRTAR